MTLKTIIRDGTGTGNLAKVTDTGDLSVTNRDYYLEISKGEILGTRQFVINGYKKGISATVLDDLSSTGVTVLLNPNGIQCAVISTSAADTAAGTGVRKVEIYYLDKDYKEQIEFVVLNDVTAVNTVATNIQRIQWIHAIEVGTGGVAAGTISLTNVAATQIYEVIDIGGNMSLTSHFTIPANNIGYIMSWNASGVIKALTIRLRATVDKYTRDLLPGVFLFQDVIILNNSTGPYIKFPSPLVCPPKTDIKVSAIADSVGGDAIASFALLLVNST